MENWHTIRRELFSFGRLIIFSTQSKNVGPIKITASRQSAGFQHLQQSVQKKKRFGTDIKTVLIFPIDFFSLGLNIKGFDSSARQKIPGIVFCAFFMWGRYMDQF